MDAFESLDVWKRSSRLCAEIYKTLKTCPNRGYVDQATRSALSVPSNIAEGYERGSRNEYRRFLKIAQGSCGELRTQLYIGIDVGFLDRAQGVEFLTEVVEISKMLQGLINRL